LLYNNNNSYHKAKPIDLTKKNEDKIYFNLYGYEKEKGNKDIINFNFKIGDFVRHIKNKGLFEKGYTSAWSDKLYIVSKIIFQNLSLYKLDEIQTEIKKTAVLFYEKELQKIKLPFDTFLILDEDENKLLVQKLNQSEKSRNC
jgi:hypothetical protein